MQLLTVSREFGAGGSLLATELGSRLGWRVLDQDIVHRVAERLRLDDGTVEKFDEHPPSLLARIATVLIIPQPAIYSFPTPADVPSHDAIAGAARAVIEDAAASLPLIVVGHGAQCIFASHAGALHFRVVAPVSVRLRRVVDRMHIDAAFAATLLRRADQDRQAYVQRYFHTDWRNELLYDLQLNTGKMTISAAADLVLQLVETRSRPADSLRAASRPSE